VAGPKLQALLALLALSAPRPVSDHRLIDELWGDDQPAKPTNALQAQVSQLRRVLGRDTVVREPSGYALAAGVEVDSARLEDLVRDGRAAASNGEHRHAADSFATAVSLIRGPPLVDLLDRHFARQAASRLDQLVITAHEGLVDAELACGHHAAVVNSLAELVEAHPLWERFHAQLIVALFRCGRQSDALRAYAQARQVLAEEVGLEPGPELQALERAVLSHDPALAAPIALASIGHLVPLPVPLTSFVGRTEELATLERAFAAARLVTVVGPAGAGKTRLVLELASRVGFSREVWFVDLSPITDPASVDEALASAVGAQDRSPAGAASPPPPPTERAIDRLGDRSVIVILDNCEHVLDAAAEITARLLDGCRGLRIVTTSREPLGLAGEHQLVLGALSDEDAVSLFAARAEAVQPRFSADHGDVVELCRHLDGLPLAIELAAARTKTLPVPEIAARLHDRFRLLTDSKRPGDSRQRGLRAAIDWSYDLLFEDEQRAFRRLAVFAGGVTTDAAEAVCGDDALDIVTRLVDKSLLVAETSGRTARFRMLESLRAYGLDRLAGAGELQDACRDHCQWCTGLAEDVEVGIRGPEQLAWLDRLDAEHDNLRAALAQAVVADPDAALRLIGALILPWWFRSRGREARQWVEAGLAAATHPPPQVLVKALTWSGLLADFGGVVDRPGGFEHELRLADERQRRAVTLGLENGDELALASARSQHSLTLTRRALAGIAVDPAEVAALIEASTEGFARLGDHFGAGTTRTIEAVGLLVSGQLDRAAAVAEIARGHALRCGDRFVQGRVEWIEALVADAAGDAGEAYRHMERGLLLLDELGMGQEVTTQAGLLVALSERSGQEKLAAQWRTFVAGRTGGLTRHDVLLMASARNSEGLHARRAGELDRALGAHLAALASYTEAGAGRAIAFTESCLGFLAAEVGDPKGARAHHGAALAAASTVGEPACLALALEGTASTFRDGQAEWAVVLLGAASRLWAESVDPGGATHREDVAAVADRARAVLGNAAFGQARERGALLGQFEALALARSSPSRPTSGSPQPAAPA
jgi:predicted ATPase/DNA-binding SARP family transcriptional activator